MQWRVAAGIVERMEPPDPLPISLVVIAQNEEARLEDCLRSARFCADRFVLDGGSTDGTVELARRLGARTAWSSPP
ncbi:MAG: hypothetical protein O3A20_01075 [Planctomycetota bacterium]|nr:hypothetical protein [Planctomycetota bacterium]